MIPRVLAVSTAMSLGAIGTPLAHAEQTEEIAAARFREGREAMRRAQYAEACSKFEESERLDASLGTELNLAVCQQRLGHFVRARVLVSSFLLRAGVEDERASNARQLARELDANIAYLTIHVEPARVLGALILVDGHQLTSGTSGTIAVDPGRHHISVTAQGYVTQARALQIAERDVLVESVTLLAKPVDSPASPSLRARPTSSTSPLFYAALGTGVAGLLTAIESAAIIKLDRDKVNEHCVDKSCDATGLAAGRQGRAFAVPNIIGWSAAVGGSVLAAYLFFDKRHTSNASLAFGLSVSPTQTCLVLRGRTP